MLTNSLSSIKAEHQHLSQLRFYFTGPLVKQLLLYYCELGIIFVVLQANRKRNASMPLFITNSRAPYMTCAVKLQKF